MKCRQCGLVNFRTATVCKRCGTSLTVAAEPLDNQSGEVWRDEDLLVLVTDQSAQLPELCMKCSSDQGISEKMISLGYYPKDNLVLLFFGFVYYQKFKVRIYLCEQHLSRRGKTMLISVLLICVGIVAFFVGKDSLFFLFGGFVVFAAGWILLTIDFNPVSITRFEKPYLWIKGVDKDYLAGLPQWTNR